MNPSNGESRVAVVMVAALTRNGVIGVDNRLPWHLPEDLKFFKRITLGKPLVMGRKTFDSIGRPLPGRLNIVVTRDTSFQREGVRVCHDLADALALAERQAIAEGVDEIAVIGGGEIFTQAMPRASRLYLTEIDTTLEGDAYFPPLDDRQWQEIERRPGRAEGTDAQADKSDTQEGRPDYAFVVYERR
ncbi:dihydrofolate reductase [Modicisalibacter ilicicola DSM 19980]|uniref:Dihydrofolate reductase n=1 Tax=Modicisalibacter ilicicola DSM 19980 TaxID=1121942 RepID=A0A1M4SSK1_9GAMM|nr:dihydrofolate reductase [Halomonas ilicicola]SHE35169.1 dihydrofolate reductase [Halomonas ilicicola DSM 19980]